MAYVLLVNMDVLSLQLIRKFPIREIGLPCSEQTCSNVLVLNGSPRRAQWHN